HTSDTVLRLRNLPKRIIVLGGHYLGTEFAPVPAALRSEGIHIKHRGQLLPNRDRTSSYALTRAAKQRWQVEPNRTLHSIEQAGDRLRVNVSATGQRQDEVVDHFLGDVVLLATGRIPNTDRLNLGAAGIDTVGDAIARD